VGEAVGVGVEVGAVDGALTTKVAVPLEVGKPEEPE
jgi:hypothetical protein